MSNEETFKKVMCIPWEFLAFDGSVLETRVVELTLTNTSNIDIVYKMKGTSPDFIQMKPGYGYLKPNEGKVIKIKMLPWRGKNPHRERLVLLFAIAPVNRPTNPVHMWRGNLTPENPYRRVIPIRVEGFDGYKESSPKEALSKRIGSAKSKSGKKVSKRIRKSTKKNPKNETKGPSGSSKQSDSSEGSS